MTAEVAIMNKIGLSLAADSAVTSGRDGFQKVYNSANKLFSLSKYHPVGIMVYGSASFMEVPWEVIIKSYRTYLKDKKFDTLDLYLEDFLEYLRQDVRINTEEVEEIIIHRTFSDALKRLVNEVEKKIEYKKEVGEEVKDKDVTSWLTKAVDRDINKYEQMEPEFITVNFDVFEERFSKVVREIKSDLIMYTIPESLEKKLIQLAYEVTKKDFFSRGSSGIVIAGYGEKEIFPHLVDYRLEGFVNGQLKYKKQKERKIHYTQGKGAGTASITAFAQREMVDSFMGGIEPNMEDAIFGIIEEVISGYPKQLEKQLGIKFSDRQVRELEKMGKELYTSIEDAVEEYQYNNYIRPLLGIVRSLPKEELADMAESLINLTSFKRRVTRDTESVGPPIDVAVITKGDGFVWVKRKNYFDPDLNPQFFQNLKRGDNYDDLKEE